MFNSMLAQAPLCQLMMFTLQKAKFNPGIFLASGGFCSFHLQINEHNCRTGTLAAVSRGKELENCKCAVRTPNRPFAFYYGINEEVKVCKASQGTG